MTRSSWIVPAALSCAVLAGCSGAPATTTAPPAPTATAAAAADPATAWMEKYCGALTGISDAARKQPSMDLTSPEKTLAGLTDYVDGFVTALDGAITNLKTVGPAPSPVGDAAVADLTTSLTKTRKGFAKVKKQLAASSADDVDKILAPLSNLEDPPDPLDAVAKDPQLSKAGQNAPSCQKIKGIA